MVLQLTDYLLMAGFCLLPVLFLIWGYAWWKRDQVPVREYVEFLESDTADPKWPEKRIMAAGALCEQRRHGRHLGPKIVVEWDTRRNFRGIENGRIVSRGDYDVAVTAEWLEREGPKNGIEVKRVGRG
jgi:hypothetical protein